MRLGTHLAPALLGAALLGAACAHTPPIRTFPLREPMWVDSGDYRPFRSKPEEYESPWIWDGADQIFFRPASEAFRFERPTEAVDVNSMDEVPSSTWYENRASRETLSVDRFVEGACGERAPLDPRGPWTIVSAKTEGANPGFLIEDTEGRKYLLKFDSPEQPYRTTTAEVVGSMLYWAAGYHVPCNRIVAVDRRILTVGEGARMEIGYDGDEVPLEQSMLDPIFDGATRMPDGRYRASASALLEGEPLGPWRYSGTRQDDPNDVVPHEHRRELRGGYVLAAWILHYDTRDANTLSMWTPHPRGGFVAHHLIDFGDSLGSMWPADGISRRIGHGYYFDFPQVFGDFFSLGAIRRPWRSSRLGPAGPSLGYFDVEHFEADEWKPGYKNPAFDRATERDLAWMARIVANITPEHVRAAVRTANIPHRVVRTELERILLGRREKILRRYLSKLSPLTWPRLEEGPRGARVCVRDLGVATGIAGRWDERPYWTRAYRHTGARIETLPPGKLARKAPDQVCADLPDAPGASPEHPAYVLVDLGALDGPDDREAHPLRIHLYQLGPSRYDLVGLERPSSTDAPVAR